MAKRGFPKASSPKSPKSPKMMTDDDDGDIQFTEDDGPRGPVTDLSSVATTSKPASRYDLNKGFWLTHDVWGGKNRQSQMNREPEDPTKAPEDHDYFVVTAPGPQEARVFKNAQQVTSFIAPCKIAVSSYGIFALDSRGRLWRGDEILSKDFSAAAIGAHEDSLWVLTLDGHVFKNRHKVGTLEAGIARGVINGTAAFHVHRDEYWALSPQGKIFRNGKRQRTPAYPAGTSIALSSFHSKKSLSILHSTSPLDLMPDVAVAQEAAQGAADTRAAGKEAYASSSSSSAAAEVANAPLQADQTVHIWIMTPTGTLFKDYKKVTSNAGGGYEVAHGNALACIDNDYYVLNQNGSVFRNGVQLEAEGSYKDTRMLLATEWVLLEESQLQRARKDNWPSDKDTKDSGKASASKKR